MTRDQARSPFAKAFSLPFGAVSWTGGLWRERFETVGRVTVPHLERMFDAADVSHVTENFRIAAGEAEGRASPAGRRRWSRDTMPCGWTRRRASPAAWSCPLPRG